MKSVLKISGWTAGAVILAGMAAIGGFLLFSRITEFTPRPVENSRLSRLDCTRGIQGSDLTIVSWNIGYGGLGKEMDFFYDGGSRIRPGYTYYIDCLDGICRMLNESDTVNFFFLQEIDHSARRSYYLDQVSRISGTLPDMCYSYVVNYDCRFVPVPVSSPMGRVEAGMMICSGSRPDSVARIGFDRHPAWPGRMFNMKRCFMASWYSLTENRKLVLVNVHNSAFDTGGFLRQREMQMLSDFMTGEYRKGNFVLAGGDWNANPPGFDPSLILTGDRVKTDPFDDLSTYFPGWRFAFDPAGPTNRNVDTPYKQGQTLTTIIDFFLVSPNLEIITVSTLQRGFEFSDHNPVCLRFRFK
jgi:hypothetical protein